MIAKLERAHSNVQQNMKQTAVLERPTSSMLFVWKSQYCENVSIDAMDNNTRLKHA